MVRVALIGQTTANASRREQDRLKLTAADRVMRVARVRYLKKRPVSFEMIVLPLSRFPGIGRNNEVAPGIAELANQHDLPLGVARERVSVGRVGKLVAGHLHVREGTRLLKLDRTTSTADGTPIEWRVSFVVPSR